MSMQSLAQQLTEQLTAPVVVKAQKEVARQTLPEKRAFDKAVSIANMNNLSRLSYLCDIARNKPTGRKVEQAQQALLEFLQKHTAAGTRHLTAEQFVQLSSYYKLTLAGLTAAQISKNASIWTDSASMYEYIAELPFKQHRAANNH